MAGTIGSGEVGPRSTELLGFPDGARVLILNLDDFGMYRGTNVAVIRSIEDGIGASCSLMVPCRGARHAMGLLQNRPQIPFGIHLTLFCDTTQQRWGPLADARTVPTLLDRTGQLFTPDHVADLLAQARPAEVELEFRRQIEAVVDAGLTPTHLDWHCLADGGRDEIFQLTLALADEYGLAIRASRDPARHLLRAQGLPVVDHDFLDSFRLDTDGKADRYVELLRCLPQGLSEWGVHPGLGDKESRSIDPGWRVRRADYEFLVSPKARQTILEEPRVSYASTSGRVPVIAGRASSFCSRTLRSTVAR
jgi:predicted glycoside hydrolase/deacetylase ChbG (UPF0249 family)